MSFTMKNALLALATIGSVAASPMNRMDKRTFDWDICLPSINCGFEGYEIFYNKPYYTGSENPTACANRCNGDSKCQMYSVASGQCHCYAIGPLLGAFHWPNPGGLKFYDNCCAVPSSGPSPPSPA